MAADLTGLTPGGVDDTYKWLAHFGVQGALPADGGTPVILYKGDGTATPISMTATKLFVNGIEVLAAKNKLNATVAPNVNDDITYGYSVGSKWYDLTAQEAYLCFDATNGAAVWEKATLTADELGDAAFKNTGTGAGTVAAGNDSRLTDSRTPLSHTHGNITNVGAIGSTSNLPVITTTSGVLTTGSFGTSANTFCQGNDSRLSDERVPTAAGLAAKITAATSKATPVDADEIPLIDSAASFGLKKLTWANLKATAKTYFDTLYVALTGNQTVAGAKTFSGQTELTGQDATNATSAMTRELSRFDDVSPSIISYRDDFHAPNTGYGEMNWYRELEGTAATTSTPTGAHPYMGLLRISSGTDNLKGACIYKGYLNQLIAQTNWEATFIARLEQTTDCDMIVGFTLNGGNVGLYGSYGAQSFGVRYSSARDTNFMFYSKNTNTDFAANDANNFSLSSGVAVDTLFHKFGIRSLSTGVIQMKIDSGAWTTVSHVNSNSNYLPYFLILSRTTSQKYIEIDFYSFIQQGLSR